VGVHSNAPSGSLNDRVALARRVGPLLIVGAAYAWAVAEGRSRETGTRTILFTDLVGSTALRSALGDVAADKVWREHDRLLREAIAQHSGTLAQDLGDGVMAVFEAAADGAACAVAMQQEIDRLRRRRGLELSMRVGLSTGDVAIEGDGWSGMPVVEAARLEAAAGGDQILASELVRLLAGTRTAVSFESVGELTLKGLASPLAACAIAWDPLPEVSVLPLPPALRTSGFSFVERDAEQETLSSVWESARARGVRGALVAGDAGIGKTRLAAEFAAHVHATGAVVLVGRCDEDLAVPYQPFVEALRYFVNHAPEDMVNRLGRYPGELTRLVPELAARVAHLPPALQADPETERFRLFDAIASWLGAASQDDPLLLVLEDLHWATKPTTLLLRHLLRADAAAQLLILATYRQTDLARDAPLRELLADLHRSTDAERITLEGLEEAGVAALLADALARPLTSDEVDLARRIRAETAGNAFFASEVVRQVGESGMPYDSVAIPDTVREVVGRRLARLSDDADDVLVTAAVTGTEFDAGLLSAVAARPEADVITALDEATEAHLLEEMALDQYRFAHSLVREAIHDKLSQGRRVRLHRLTAQAIRRIYVSELDEHLVALAYHLSEASHGDKSLLQDALSCARRAGDRALLQLAPEEAVQQYEMCLELMERLRSNARAPASTDSGAEARRSELLVALGDARTQAGLFAEARAVYSEAAELAANEGDALLVAHVALQYAGPGRVQERDPRERVLLELALAMVEENELAVRASLLAHLAAEYELEEFGKSAELAENATSLAERSGDPLAIARAAYACFWTGFFPDAVEAQRRLAERTIENAERARNFELEFEGLTITYMPALLIGDREAIQRTGYEHARRIKSTAQPLYLAYHDLADALEPLIEGRLEKAESVSARALTRSSDLAILGGHSLQLGMIRRWQDRLDELEPLMRSFVTDDRSGGTGELTALALLGLHAVAQGDPLEASNLLRAVKGENFDRLPPRGTWNRLPPLALSAELAARVNDVKVADQLHDEIEAWDGLHFCAGWTVYLGPASLYLGMLEHALGRPGEAATHLRDSIRSAAQMQAWPHQALARVELARVVASDDVSEARSLLLEAQTAADKLGLALVTKEIERLRNRTSAQNARRSTT
jgi:class 3 adenylate cyclase